MDIAALITDAGTFSSRLAAGARSADLVDAVRAWRGACAGSPAAQCALADARAARLLVAYLGVCEEDFAAEASGGADSANAARARRVGWQALVNLCAGSGAPERARAAVFRAITRGTGARCALESGARAGVTDAALAEVVLCAVHTSSRGSPARLLSLATRSLLLLPLLRLAAPAGGGAGDGLTAVEADDGAIAGVRFLAEELLKAGLVPAALATARRGLSAGALLDVAGGGSGVTTEATIFVHAVAVAAESALYGSAETRGGASRRTSASALGAALAAAAPTVADFLVAAGTSALSTPSTGTDAQSILRALHVGLCIRATQACANLLGDSFALQSDTSASGGAAVGAAAFGPPSESGVTSDDASECVSAGDRAFPSSGEDVDPPDLVDCAFPSSDEDVDPPDPVDAVDATRVFPPPNLAATLIRFLVAASPRAASSASPPADAPAPRFDGAPSDLRTSIVRCMALLLSRAEVGAQGFVSEAVCEGATAVLLAQTALHEHTVTLREWAMLATRELAHVQGAGGDAARAEIIAAAARARSMQNRVDTVGREAESTE
jgi:hypothetical protein